MFNSRSIQGILTLAIGMAIAVWLGTALVTDQFETLLKVGGSALLLISAFVGRRIWLLLVFMVSANVVLYRWFGTTDIGQILFIGFSILLFLMRKLHFRLIFTELHFWAFLIVVCVLQAYFRNPVGLNIMGAGNVGGRPYFVIALWVLTSVILSSLIVQPRELKWAVWVSLLGGVVGIPLQMARYGNFTSIDQEDLSRIPSASTVATLLARWLTARISPIRACFHPLWAFILLLSLGLAAFSGYRNAVANIGFIYIAGILYRSGFSSFLGSIVMGGLALSLLAFVNLNFPLPGNIQRALSPLPGTWEKQYRRGGELSTEWRVEMWREALTSDRWIHNKILGDGIGMTSSELGQSERLAASRIGRLATGLTLQQENMLLSGSFHSGPVHSIRMVGYVGLLVLIGAMIRLAVHAHRQIMRCQGTEWHTVALFFGLPLITQPFFFLFVFGEYHTAIAQTLYGMAMILILERNLPLPAWNPVRSQPYLLNTRSRPEPIGISGHGAV